MKQDLAFGCFQMLSRFSGAPDRSRLPVQDSFRHWLMPGPEGAAGAGPMQSKHVPVQPRRHTCLQPGQQEISMYVYIYIYIHK